MQLGQIKGDKIEKGQNPTATYKESGAKMRHSKSRAPHMPSIYHLQRGGQTTEAAPLSPSLIRNLLSPHPQSPREQGKDWTLVFSPSVLAAAGALNEAFPKCLAGSWSIAPAWEDLEPWWEFPAWRSGKKSD